MIRERDNSYKLIFEKPINYRLTGHKRKDVEEITIRCTRLIETYVKKYPDQWFIFKKFWEPAYIQDII